MRSTAVLALLLALALPATAQAQAGTSYLVPPDNPFVGRAGAAPEIYSYGLRNPYRFAFDRANGDLVLGDVGQGTQEEVDWSTLRGARGANFGWPCREGVVAGPGGSRCPIAGTPLEPLFHYPTAGSAVIGGYVVRDPSLTGLVGRYLYADYYVGQVRSLALNFSTPDDRSTGLTLATGQLGAFGQDAAGHLYVTDQDAGAVYRLVAGATAGTLATSQVAGNYLLPTYVTSPPGDNLRLFVVEQAGRVRLVKDGVALPTPFLDLSDLVLDGGERGLLSMAFPPDYAATGRFYVYFTDAGGDIRIEEYRRSADPDRADRNSRRLVLAIEHSSESNHNGGQLQFGPDGYLYAGTGDGGGGNDIHDNAQNLSTRLGKLLRIDPDLVASGGGPLPTARDITPPLMRTKIPPRQRVLRLGGVVGYVRSSEGGSVSAGARLRVGHRTFVLAKVRWAAQANSRVRVKVRLSRRARRALRAALKRGGHPYARLGLRARDAAGNGSKLVRRRVAVRR